MSKASKTQIGQLVKSLGKARVGQSSLSTTARNAWTTTTSTSGSSSGSSGSANAVNDHPLSSPNSSGSSSSGSGSGSSAGNKHAQLPSFWIQPPSSTAGYPPPPSLLFNPGSSSSANNSGNTAGNPSSTFRLNLPSTRIPQHNSQIHHAQYTLHHGAYGIPKRPRASKGKGKEPAVSSPESSEGASELENAVAELQTQELLSVQVGEDAYFVRNDSLGVADGVGGWAGRKGADPGLFAARLMHHCSAELGVHDHLAKLNHNTGGSPSRLSFVASSSSTNLRKASSDSPSSAKPTSSSSPQSAKLPHQTDSHSSSSMSLRGEGDPIEILHQAWDLTLTEFFDLELIGSTTALIALLKDDELRVANLGDCCCSIIRGQDYIFRSQEQQHSFNYPYQVGTNSQDTPRKDGQRFNIKVQKDDIVILSSDGLVDNLFDEDILEEVLRYQPPFGSPQELSKALCSRAKAVSEDQRAVTSPFQQRANEEGIHFVGGKHDDISVLVAIIGDSQEQLLAPA